MTDPLSKPTTFKPKYLMLWRGDILGALPERLFLRPNASLRSPGMFARALSEPAAIRAALGEAGESLPKPQCLVETLEPLLGSALVLAEGSDWARLRRVMEPILAADPRNTVPHIHWAAQAAIARHEGEPTPLALAPFARRLSADIMFRLLFSRPIEEAEAEDLIEAIDRFSAAAPAASFGAVFPSIAGRYPSAKSSGLVAARGLRKLFAQLVARHRLAWVKGKRLDDLAGQLLAAEDPETGKPIGKVELVDQVAGLFVLGQELSASALTWTLLILAAHPSEQSAIAAEAEAAFESGAGDPETLKGLSRAAMAAREALRLYPPMPLLLRDQMSEGRSAEQSLLSLWHLHRDPLRWSDAEGFHPGRWHTDEPKGEWLAFGAGSRRCPAAGLAMDQLTLLTALICRSWELQSVDEVPKAWLGLALKARQSPRVSITRRR